MITLTREEAQQVLDVLNDVRYRIEFGQMNLSDDTDAAIETFRVRLAQPEREWQGLTDEEAKEVWKQLNYDLNHGKFAADDTERHVIVEFYRAIEAKLREKNT